MTARRDHLLRRRRDQRYLRPGPQDGQRRHDLGAAELARQPAPERRRVRRTQAAAGRWARAAGSRRRRRGTTWAAQTSGTAVHLNGVACADATTCWAVGNTTGAGLPATILTTTNGGSSWSPQASNTTQQLSERPSSTRPTAGRSATAEPSSPTSTTRPRRTRRRSTPRRPAPVRHAPAWAFSGEDGATFECRLDRGSDVISAWTPCTDEVAYDLAGEVDGTYTFSVRATDAAGNTGLESHSDYELDTAIPRRPRSPPRRPRSPRAARRPGRSPASRARPRVPAGQRRGPRSSPGARAPAPELPADRPARRRLHVLGARHRRGGQRRPARRTPSRSTRPRRPRPRSPRRPRPRRQPVPAWAFSAEAGATTECRLDRGNTSCGLGRLRGSESYDLSGEPDGTYTFSVRATDAAGNVGAPATSAYALDTTAPAPRTHERARLAVVGENPSWAFTAEAGATIECSLDPQGSRRRTGAPARARRAST